VVIFLSSLANVFLLVPFTIDIICGNSPIGEVSFEFEF